MTTITSRRQALTLLGSGMLAGPLILTQELARPHRQTLPPVWNGTVLTAEMWNAVVARVNELSSRP